MSSTKEDRPQSNVAYVKVDTSDDACSNNMSNNEELTLAGKMASPLEVKSDEESEEKLGEKSPNADPAIVKTASVVEGEDEVDRLSQKYFKDFRFYFQHPYSRLVTAYLVTFCNFLIYAEDPVAHSEKECFIPVVGNCFSFVCTRYPSHRGWVVLKVALWIIAIIIGMIVGKLVVHQRLFQKCFKLRMFHADQGSWMTMFMTCIISVFIFSWIYNGFLMLGGDATIDYRISSLMGIKNSWFMKAAACGTWCGDFFTAWMVTDVMLQEKLYPWWGKSIRKWWNAKFHRIILFWVVTSLTSIIVVMAIGTNWIKWDRLNRDFLPTNEVSRGFLASFILVMDLLIIMQDWDFPHFTNTFDIKLPGLNTASFKLHLPRLLRKRHWIIHISGKWFNYGIIFIVMLLDLNMWKNQIFYTPFEYGQYIGPQRRIFSVLDSYSLENYNMTYVTYAWRSNNTDPATNATYLEGDKFMNSQYHGYTLKVKGIAFIPCLAAFTCLGVLVWYFGRVKPTKDHPYPGRRLLSRISRSKISRLYLQKKYGKGTKPVIEDTDGGGVRVISMTTKIGGDEDTVDAGSGDGGKSIVNDITKNKDIVSEACNPKLSDKVENGKHKQN